MNKTKFKELFKFSIAKYFTNKWFALFNVLLFISLILGINFSNLQTIFDSDSKKPFILHINDKNDYVSSTLTKDLESGDQFKILVNDDYKYDADTIDKYDIILNISDDEEQVFKTELVSREGILNDIVSKITASLLNARNKLFEEKYDIDIETIELIQSELKIERTMLSVDSENAQTKQMLILLSAAIPYFLYVIVFSRIASEVSQEKQSKSSEYILTAVSAKDYLLSKVLSHAFILFVQGFLIVCYYLVSAGILGISKISTTDISISGGFSTSGITVQIIMYLFTLIFFNILNLILLSIVQATLAARTSSSTEAGNSVSIITFITSLLFIFTTTISPYQKISPVLHILSTLPILSGFFMPTFMIINQANIITLILSLVLLVWLIPTAFRKCAKFFKDGLLDYKKVKKSNDEHIEKSYILQKRDFKHLGFIIGTAIVIYVGMQTIASVLGEIFVDTILSNFNETEQAMLLQLIAQIFSIVPALLFVKLYIKKDSSNTTKKLYISRPRMLIISVAIIYIVQIFFTLFVFRLFGIDYDVLNTIDFTHMDTPFAKFLVLFTLAIVPAIFEELFFRKSLIDLLKPYGASFAIIFSSILFGLMHMNLSQSLFAFTIGLVFGSIYYYTKDIKISMLIHFINNGVAALTLILANTTIKMPYLGIPIPCEAIISLLLMIAMIVGLVFAIIFVSKVTKEKKWRRIPFLQKSCDNQFKYRYLFLFYDYVFDFSVIILLIMSILTENILNSIG